MSLPHGMSHAARDHAQDRPVNPRSLTVLLVVLVVMGVVGTGASVVAAQASTTATRVDVEQNESLIRRVGDLEKEQSARNEELHADLCRLVYEVVMTAPSLRDRGITPCRSPEIP